MRASRRAVLVHCTIRPRALRVRLPRDRPGVTELRGKLDWKTLWHLAFGRSHD